MSSSWDFSNLRPQYACPLFPTISGAKTFNDRWIGLENKTSTDVHVSAKTVTVGDTVLVEDDLKELLKLIPENRQLKERLAKLEQQFGPIVDHLASRTRTKEEYDELEQVIANNVQTVPKNV